LQLKAMPKSKASADDDDHLQEFQLLKQDVQENQTEIAAMRAKLNYLSAKQDQVHLAVTGMHDTVNDVSSQMLSMAEAIKSMRLSNTDKVENLRCQYALE
jgi:hypothetical protein